jgi:hypothetical protein
LVEGRELAQRQIFHVDAVLAARLERLSPSSGYPRERLKGQAFFSAASSFSAVSSKA